MADFTLVADRAYLNRILIGDVTITGEMQSAIERGAPAAMVVIVNAIDSGEGRLEGGLKADVQRFFSDFIRSAASRFRSPSADGSEEAVSL